MKKTIIALALIALALALPADIPPRIVEFGIDAEAGASNNYFLFTDFFPADGVLLLDLDAIAQGVAWNGLSLSADARAGVFLNVNLPKKLKVGIFAGADAYAWGSLPSELFRFLAEGNAPDETITGNFGLRGDVFAEIGAKASLGWGPWTFRLSPAFFGTAVHVGQPVANFSFATDSAAGTITMTADASVPVSSSILTYTEPTDPYPGEDTLPDNIGAGLLSFMTLFDDFYRLNGFGFIPEEDILGAILNSGGVDVTLGADYLLLPGLTLGATLKHVPLVPARLAHQYTISTSMTSTIDSLLGDLGTADEGDIITNDGSMTVTTSDGATNVFRPFKGGFSAVWIPSGLDFLSVSGNLDFVGYEGFYVDFGAKAQATLKNAITGYYSLSFEDLIWKNRIGFAFNLRVFELNGVVSMQSADFIDSFTPRGLYAALGLRFGF